MWQDGEFKGLSQFEGSMLFLPRNDSRWIRVSKALRLEELLCTVCKSQVEIDKCVYRGNGRIKLRILSCVMIPRDKKR